MTEMPAHKKYIIEFNAFTAALQAAVDAGEITAEEARKARTASFHRQFWSKRSYYREIYQTAITLENAARLGKAYAEKLVKLIKEARGEDWLSAKVGDAFESPDFWTELVTENAA